MDSWQDFGPTQVTYMLSSTLLHFVQYTFFI